MEDCEHTNLDDNFYCIDCGKDCTHEAMNKAADSPHPSDEERN